MFNGKRLHLLTAAAILAMSIAGWTTVTAAQDDPVRDRRSAAEAAAPAGADPAYSGPLQYRTVTPCRLFDSRTATGGAKYSASQTRDLFITGDGSAGETFAAQGGVATGCDIPWNELQTAAVMINITAVEATGRGFVRAWPIDQSEPTATLLAFGTAMNSSNAVAVPIAINVSGDIKLKVYGASTHIVGDVVGFFAP